ncbi:hypothetical protein BHM03_00012567 [Ensete ventricosum]|nr:hypothetical protein BHM03_00012567 [Ensete ventricosum]
MQSHRSHISVATTIFFLHRRRYFPLPSRITSAHPSSTSSIAQRDPIQIPSAAILQQYNNSRNLQHRSFLITAATPSHYHIVAAAINHKITAALSYPLTATTAVNLKIAATISNQSIRQSGDPYIMASIDLIGAKLEVFEMRMEDKLRTLFAEFRFDRSLSPTRSQ